MLGLQVKLPDLDDYEMSSRESYEERMALFKAAIKEMNREARSRETEY